MDTVEGRMWIHNRRMLGERAPTSFERRPVLCFALCGGLPVAPFAVDFAASAVPPKTPSPADLLGGLPPSPSAPSLHVRGAGVRAERRGGINGEAQCVRVEE
jgi:hypothetical protein